MKLKGILFDLDGTLADTLPVCIQAYQATVEHFGNWTPGDEEIMHYFGTSEEGILERFFPGQLNNTLPYFLNCYDKLHTEKCLNLFPGIDKALALLALKHIQTAIVTGKGSHSAAISMRLLGLDRWINIVQPGFPDKADKPYSIRKVIDRWGIQPGEAAYIGDTPYDMHASQEVGLLPIGAAWASTSTLGLDDSAPTYKIFKNTKDFIGWVESL